MGLASVGNVQNQIRNVLVLEGFPLLSVSSQSLTWINEVWLGRTISPSYVGEPECNGVAGRFMRALKEQCIYLHQFTNPEEDRQLIGEFIARYNTEWLIEGLGYRPPAQARVEALARVA